MAASPAAVPADQQGPVAMQAQQQTQTQSLDAFEQQMAAVMSAAAGHLQRAQAAASAPDSTISQQQQQELLRSILRSEITAAESDGCAPSAAPGEDDERAGEQEQSEVQQQQPQQVAWLLKLGPKLSTAVKKTQLLRLLSALLLAYAVLSGWDMGVPPAILVPFMDVLVIASAVVVLGSTSYGQRLAAAEAAAASKQEVQVPMRLRSFDFLSLLPGAKELLTVISGYRQFANALSEDVAVYIVGLGLLTVMISSVAA